MSNTPGEPTDQAYEKEMHIRWIDYIRRHLGHPGTNLRIPTYPVGAYNKRSERWNIANVLWDEAVDANTQTEAVQAYLERIAKLSDDEDHDRIAPMLRSGNTPIALANIPKGRVLAKPNPQRKPTLPRPEFFVIDSVEDDLDQPGDIGEA
jgi:hypothetical protein